MYSLHLTGLAKLYLLCSLPLIVARWSPLRPLPFIPRPLRKSVDLTPEHATRMIASILIEAIRGGLVPISLYVTLEGGRRVGHERLETGPCRYTHSDNLGTRSEMDKHR